MRRFASSSVEAEPEFGVIANILTMRWGACTIMVHNGVMAASKTTIVRQSVSLPTDTARRVQKLAKGRRLSANRMLVELVEDGLAAQERKEREFFALAERFRAAIDKKEVEKLGNELGRMVFGG